MSPPQMVSATILGVVLSTNPLRKCWAHRRIARCSAALLTLTVPEMPVLVGVMRALDANTGQTATGNFMARGGSLTQDFFVNLLDMSTQWSKSATTEGVYKGHDRKSGALKWTATAVDLVLGSNAELRAVAEVHASAGGREKLVQDFVKAWTKVMNLEGFDLT